MSDQTTSRRDLEELFPEPVITVEEAAARLRLHPVTVTRAIKRGHLAALHGLGRPYHVTRSAVIEWALGTRPLLDGGEVAAEEPRPGDPATAARPAESSIERRRAVPRKRRAA